MGRVYRPPMTCIPLHVKKAPCAEYLHTAYALVTFIVVRTAKVASRRLWAKDATPPGSAPPAMGADALRRPHRSSQARGVVHQPPPRLSPGPAVRAGGRHRGGQTPCRHPREGGRAHAGGVHVAYASPGHGRRDDPPVQMLSGRCRRWRARRGDTLKVAARQRERRVHYWHRRGAQFPGPDAGARRGMRESAGHRVCRHPRGDAAG